MGGTLNIPFGFLFFLLAFGVYWVNAFFIMYHLSRFGIGTYPKLVALIFFVGSVALFTTTLVSYYQMDLAAAIEQFDLNFLRGIPRTY